MKKTQLQQIVREEVRNVLKENNNAPSQLMSTPVVAKAVEDIITLLKRIDVDGETMQYILTQVGMEDQMKSQLTPMMEGNAASWSKQQLDKELKMLQQGGQEMAQDMGGRIDDAMAFDIADGWISDNPGVEQAIKKHYGVYDAQGFIANYVA